ncbi:MAG: DUF192 domain-containing protein, partial [Nitrospirota bacterium]
LVLSLVLIAGSLFLTGRKDTDTIIVTFPSGKEIEAEVADTPEKLLFGLAFRDGLPPDSGMLYIFETSDRHRVRTKGFKIPVDMIWVDASRHVVHLVERADPCPQDPCPLYGPPPENARYVIQTAAGFLEQERLAPGAELKFTLRL